MREMMTANPGIEPIISAHLQQLQFMMAPPPMPAEPGGRQTSRGQDMRASNRESGAIDTLPGGTQQFGPSVGPM